MIFFLFKDMWSIILYLNCLCWRISSTSFKKSCLIFFLCSSSWASSSIIFSRSWKSTWSWIIYAFINDIFLFFLWISWAIFHNFMTLSSSFYKTVSQMSFSANIHLELYSSADDSDLCDFQTVLKALFTMILICFTAFFQTSFCLIISFFDLLLFWVSLVIAAASTSALSLLSFLFLWYVCSEVKISFSLALLNL